MQRCLIDNHACDKQIAVIFADGHAFKPVSPFTTQMSLDPNLIDLWFIGVGWCISFVAHVLYLI